MAGSSSGLGKPLEALSFFFFLNNKQFSLCLCCEDIKKHETREAVSCHYPILSLKTTFLKIINT